MAVGWFLTNNKRVCVRERRKLRHDIVPQGQVEDAKGADVDLCAILEHEVAQVLLEDCGVRLVAERVGPFKRDTGVRCRSIRPVLGSRHIQC